MILREGNKILRAEDKVIFNNDLLYPTDGLVAYWKFDNNLIDSWDGHNLMNDGSVYYTSGVNGSCMNGPDSSLSYIYNMDNSLVDIFSGQKSYSISFWIKRYDPSITDPQYIINITRDGIKDENRTSFVIYGENLRFANLYRTNDNGIGFEPDSVIPDDWNHYVLVFDYPDGYLYVNKKLISTSGYLPTTVDSSANRFDLFRPYDYDTAEMLDYIDGVYIYNKPLTSQEVEKLYDAHG